MALIAILLKLWYITIQLNSDIIKAILINVKKAYDSVSRNKLKETITYNFNAQEANFLKSFIEIYEILRIDIYRHEINPIHGVPQGSTLSPLFFNLYINESLEKLNSINGLSAQCYADDLILLSDNLEIL